MSFNDELGQEHRDQATLEQEQTQRQATEKLKGVGNKTRQHGTNYVKKKLGLDSGVKNKTTKAATNTGRKVAQITGQAAKKAARAAGQFIVKIGGKLGASALGVLAPFGAYIAAAIVVVGAVSIATSIITDEEYSRTNTANYQHVKYTDGNTLMQNYTSGNGNVYFNPDTKRYELAKGKAPTEANKLYYVYYAIMANQSRWFVEYERTGTKPGDPGAGTKSNPYFKPLKRDNAYTKYTLDGYMFNNNVIDKVGLRSVSSGKDVKLENLIDESAADSVKRLSINMNLLYLLNSTLNGSIYGTGKNQMYFSEQFVKPVYHDENYNFKALTEYRNMTQEEKAKFASKAHGDAEDSTLENKFQEKYKKWGQTLDAQNEARGGSNENTASGGGNKNTSASSGPATADGISNPILKKAVEWGLSQLGKGITYSMSGSRNGSDGTMDCSGFVSTALKQGGGYDVPLMSTVTMLTNSNAMGQHGTLFREVDYKTAKKGTIIVVGGLGGGGAAGHTFFLLEDFHGDDTKVLECTGAVNGIYSENTFVWASMNYNQVVALEPTGNATGGSDSSSSSKNKDKKKSSSTRDKKAKEDLSKSTQNEYKDKISNANLIAKSREFDTQYSPKLYSDLYTKEDINNPRYKLGDYLIDKDTLPKVASDFNANMLAKAIGGIQTDAVGTPSLKNGKTAKRYNPTVNALGDYRNEKDEIVKWSIEKGYNPAFVIALISELTDGGTKSLDVSKYNFLNNTSALKNKDKENKSEDKKEDKKSDSNKTDSSSESNKDDGTGRGIQNKEYGARYYNLDKEFDTLQGGLDYLMKKIQDKNDNMSWTEQIAKSNLKLTARQFRAVNRTYSRLGGVNSPHIKLTNGDGGKVYTFNGDGAEDKNALKVISIDGKTDETDINGLKKYYTENTYVKSGSGAVAGSSGTHPYAIKRNADGSAKTTTGVWDYGFGSIFKMAKMRYYAYEIGIDKEGRYYLERDNVGNWFEQLFNAEIAGDTQYQILGATTPFGSLDMSNEIAESQYEIEKVIDKLKRNEILNGDDIAILNEHKENSSSIKTQNGVKSVNQGNFIVSTKPVLKKEPVLSDANGAQYLLDYVQNYETYIPSVVKNDLDVVERFRAMNDINQRQQEVLNKITDIFNDSIGSQSGSKSKDGDSSGGYDAGRFTGKTYKGKGSYKGDIPVSNSGNATQDEFLNKISEGAMNSWVKYGVLPSVVMGQAIIESGWGRSGLAVQNNNLFGVKGTGDAGTANWATQEQDSAGNASTINANFAAYTSFSASIEAHGKLISGNTGLSNYLAAVKEKDPLKSITAIKNGGYATAVDYVQTIMKAIKTYGLEEYDKYAIAYTDKHGFEETANGQVRNGNNPGTSLNGTEGKSTPGESVWGDGSSFWDGVVDFFKQIQDVVLSVFNNGESFDPTMFSMEAIKNDHELYQMKNGKVTRTFGAGELTINGSDAYQWDKHSHKLSNKNANMLLRQFVASIESRDNRPVYYDEIYDTFNSYDMSRILEENFKDAVEGLFTQNKEKNKPTPTGLQHEISGNFFKDKDLKKTKVDRVFGWYKENGDVRFSPGMRFIGGKNSDVNALKNGRVTFVGDTEFGKTVIIRSSNNTEQIAYAGLGQVNVSVDQNVSASTVIGKAGSNGQVWLMGIRHNFNASKGLPPVPNTAEDLNTSYYFDLGTQFGITGDNLIKIQKDVNGFATSNSSTKPNIVDVKDGKAKELGDYISASADFIMPLKLDANQKATVTSPFGQARNVTLQNGQQWQDIHNGVDLVTGSNTTKIIAAAQGEVVYAQKDQYGGVGVIVKHSDNLFTHYWHMADGSLKVKVGDKVKQGQEIGTIGSTGLASGVHLHFGVSTGQQSGFVNPMSYIK